MAAIIWNAAQEREAQRIGKILQENLAGDILQLARLLVSKKDSEIFGKTEFEVRDRVHRIGAEALSTALAERKKRGTRGRVPAALAAHKQPSSSAGKPRCS